MNLQHVESSWNALGAIDPMFGVLSDPEKLGGHWDKAAFYETGRVEIDEVFSALESFGIQITPGTALDFGCGIGRLSSALAKRFEKVLSVDIAKSMLDQAPKLVPNSNIEWILNTRSDLSVIQENTVDFVYSNIVLQHMPPAYGLRYITEFVRVAKPGGMIVFQLPDKAPYSIKWKVERVLGFLLSYLPKPLIDTYRREKYRNTDADTIKKLPRRLMLMYGARPAVVKSAVERAGGEVVAVRPTPRQHPGWHSYEYVVKKRKA